MTANFNNTGPAREPCVICQENDEREGRVNFHLLNEGGTRPPEEKTSHSACTQCVLEILKNTRLPDGLACPYCKENITSANLASVTADIKKTAAFKKEAKDKYDSYVKERLDANLPLNLKAPLAEYRATMKEADQQTFRQKQTIQSLDGNPPPLPPREEKPPPLPPRP